MSLKSYIVCAILAVLITATAFCAGMNHAVRAMQIDDCGAVTLHNQVYIHNAE